MSGVALAVSAGLCAAAACLVAAAAAAPLCRSHPRAGGTASAIAAGRRSSASEVALEPARSVRLGQGRNTVAGRVGATLRRGIGAPVDDAAAAVLGSTVLVAAPFALVDLRLGAIAVVVMRVRPILVRRKQRLVGEQRVVGELPEVIDLLCLGLASGGSTLTALRALATRPTGPVTAAMADVIVRVGAGHRMADALEELPEMFGEAIRPLVRALVSAERYGVELGPTLQRLAHDAREDRRRRAQARARRVPVQMLLPLVTCILPAFVVLTLVPTLVSTFRTLEL